MSGPRQEQVVPGESTAACILDVYKAWCALNDGESVEYEGQEYEPSEIDELLDCHVYQDPLSLQVRSGWHSPGEEAELELYEILLGTGGPAVRIIGNLSAFGEPENAKLQGQNWFTPWMDTAVTADEQEAINWYVQHFHFGV